MTNLNHIAIIMDGNGRWAHLKKKPRTFGHVKGARVAKKIIMRASDRGLKFLTLYAFSAENWLRPQEEVGFLMMLLGRYLKKETENLVKKNIRFSVIGEVERLSLQIQDSIRHAIDRTAHCTGLEVVFAISYGSRQEITNSLKQIALLVKEDNLDVNDIDEALVGRYLMTNSRPDPDLVIRTSGEYRLSNFLMWQSAYSEFLFLDVLWPDFNERQFDEACENYFTRERRYGQIGKMAHVKLAY